MRKVQLLLILFAFCISCILSPVPCLAGYHFNVIKYDVHLLDTARIAHVIDSAKTAYNSNELEESINLGQRALQLSEINAKRNYLVESSLLLARTYQKKNNPFLTIKYYVMAINELESANDSTKLPHIYTELGDLYQYWQLPNKTLEYYLKSYEIINRQNNTVPKIKTLVKIAKLYEQQGDTKEAIHYYQQLLKLYEGEYDVSHTATVFVTLSGLYKQIRNYDNSIHCSKEALIYYKKINNIQGIFGTLSEIGEASYHSGNYPQAVEYFDLYFQFVSNYYDSIGKSPEKLRFVKNLISKGEIFEIQADREFLNSYDTALACYRKAFNIIDPQQEAKLSAEILNHLGRTSYKQGDYKVAISYNEAALFYAKKINDLDYIRKSYLELARTYKKVGNEKMSLDSYNLLAAYSDSVLMKMKAASINQLENASNTSSKNLGLEHVEEIIMEQEMRELAFKRLQLQSEKNQKEIELLQQDKALQKALLHNELLKNEKVKKELELVQEQLINEKRQQQIDKLKTDQQLQKMTLKEKERAEEARKQKMALLEKENALAKTKQSYFVTATIFVSIFFIFLLIGYLHKRYVNKKLQIKNDQIAQQKDKLKEAYENLELLSNIGKSITASIIVEQIVEIDYENLNKLMDAQVFAIGLYDKDRQELYFPLIRDKDSTFREVRIDLGDTAALATYCFHQQEEIIIRDFYKEYQFFINPAKVPHEGDKNASSIIYLPLISNEQVLGVLTVQSFEKNAFNEFHLNIIRNIAVYTEIALENARTYRELEEITNHLREANENIQRQNILIEEQNQQLVSINQEKNHLISILAHDLRNPLAMAMSMTELVQFEKDRLSAEQFQASEIIWRALTRMNEMIVKILDVKAIESQKINLDLEKVNISEIFERMERHFMQDAARKNISIHYQINTRDTYAVIDRNYIIQIMENLISNALKFSKNNTEITVTLDSREDFLRIEVKDQGPGLTEEDQKKLFQKFQKLSAKPTAGEPSSGLGLSIVKKYVEVMDGKVWCESKKGSGSSFLVEFRKAAEVVTSG